MIFDLLYLAALLVLSPWLVYRALTTGRYRKDTWSKLTGQVPELPNSQVTVWFHGVSVGEIHLLKTLIAEYRARHPAHQIVVSSTTDTGLAEARRHFANVIPWPFDFTWAVGRALDSVRPSLIVLAEAELWPNFLRAAKNRGIRVAVVNARLSPRSYRRLQRVAALARRVLFDHVDVIAVQGTDYATRYAALGVRNVTVTGSIKYDGARPASAESRLNALLPWEGLTWVAGSTHAPEEAYVLSAFAVLRRDFPQLRLVLVPRHPDRFDEVAALLESRGESFIRRSRIAEPVRSPIVLLDTIGELSDAWGLADVGFVGGSLDGHRGGQSMIEPAGRGVPTVFGPHVWNFADAARRLVEQGGAVMITKPSELETEIAALLRDEQRRRAIGRAASEFVADQQGATARTLDALEGLMHALRRRAA